MFDGAGFAIFLTGALLLNITPGPDMAFTLASTARGGARAGIAAAIGVGAGSLGWAAATAAGLAAMLAASEHAFTFIRIAGGFYLLFLAVRTFSEKPPAYEPVAHAGLAKAFRAGALTNLFNPKVGLFFLAFLPGFVDVEAGYVAAQTFMLGAIFSVTGSCVLVLVAMAAGAVRERVLGSGGIASAMKYVSASIFGGLGFYLLLGDER